jgi:acetyl esterase/lipase
MCGDAAMGAIGIDVAAEAQPYEVATQSNIEYVEHDGVKLAGDLYLPQGLAKAPVIVAAHGGGWQVGSRASYRHWGPWLAKRGFGVFAINYRLSKPGQKSYPVEEPGSYGAQAAPHMLRFLQAGL